MPTLRPANSGGGTADPSGGSVAALFLFSFSGVTGLMWMRCFGGFRVGRSADLGVFGVVGGI